MLHKKNKNSTLRYIVAMQVRDYECDTQGVVNNAVYLNYLEHARNQLFWNKSISLSDLHSMGEDPVVARIEIQYVSPLCARECFYIDTQVEIKGHFKLLFHQNIFKKITEQEDIVQNSSNDGCCTIEYIDTHTIEQNENTAKVSLHARATITVAVLHRGKPTGLKNTKLYTMLAQ